MIKKITAYLAVLAFASFSSAALACSGSDRDKDGDTGLTSPVSFEVAGSDCDRSCGNKDGDSA